TAAISERSFEKKAKVDKVLNEEQKEAFYQAPASSIKETISKYNNPGTASNAQSGYGNMGLNRVVNTLAKGSASLADMTSKTSSLIKSSLDDFLTEEEDQDSDFGLDSEEEEVFQAPKSNSGKYAEPPQERVARFDSYEETVETPRAVPSQA